MEILHINAAANKFEILKAIRAAIPGGEEDPIAKGERDAVKVTGLRPTRCGQRITTVGLTKSTVTRLTIHHKDAIIRVLDTVKWACDGLPQYQELCVLVVLDIRNVFNTVL